MAFSQSSKLTSFNLLLREKTQLMSFSIKVNHSFFSLWHFTSTLFPFIYPSTYHHPSIRVRKPSNDRVVDSPATKVAIGKCVPNAPFKPLQLDVASEFDPWSVLGHPGTSVHHQGAGGIGRWINIHELLARDHQKQILRGIGMEASGVATTTEIGMDLKEPWIAKESQGRGELQGVKGQM